MNQPDVDEYSTLKIEHDGVLSWIILNRPERLNALSRKMLAEFEAAVKSLSDRHQTRVIAIRGEGRSFCSGYDVENDGEEIGEAAERDLIDDRRRLEENLNSLSKVWTSPKPTIAAVHGYCIGGGNQLATLCDMTVIADDAKVGVPSLPLGGGYISPMWVPLVGPKRAKQMSFQAATYIVGKTAANWGWANYSVPADDLIADVTALAINIARTPRDVLEVKKAAINRAADVIGWSTIMPLGAETDALLHYSRSVRLISDVIMEVGLKEAIRSFKAGELQEDLDALGQ